MVDSVNEGSQIFITATHLDKLEAPTQPTSLRYRIDDVRAGTQILDWTAIVVGSPGTSHEITVTAAQNAMLNTLLAVEAKELTLETTSFSDVRNDTFLWNVVNLRAVA